MTADLTLLHLPLHDGKRESRRALTMRDPWCPQRGLNPRYRREKPVENIVVSRGALETRGVSRALAATGARSAHVAVTPAVTRRGTRATFGLGSRAGSEGMRIVTWHGATSLGSMWPDRAGGEL